jgi:hypothetical protein
MPSLFTFLGSVFPILLAALIYQVGLPDLVTQRITENSALQWLATTTHCYASVRTLASGLPQVNCFRVANGRFSRVYLDDASAKLKSRVGHVIPGLWDGHGHLVQYGELLDSVNLFGAQSMGEVQQRLVEYKTGRPETGTQKQWLRGVGWDQANFNGLWPQSVSDFSFPCSCSIHRHASRFEQVAEVK